MTVSSFFFFFFICKFDTSDNGGLLRQQLVLKLFVEDELQLG